MVVEWIRHLLAVPSAVFGAVALVVGSLGFALGIAATAGVVAPVVVAALCDLGLCVPTLMLLCTGSLAAGLLLVGRLFDRRRRRHHEVH